MQAPQIEKLTQLIQISPVLRADEREAWLAMLPVMNDKQASDLESILMSKPVSSNPQAQSPVLSPVRQQEKMVMPQLRHITNLPTNVPFETAPAQEIKNNIEDVKPVTKLDVAQIIKHQVEEKELPSGQDHIPLELEAPHSKNIEEIKRPIHQVIPQSDGVKAILERRNVPLQKSSPFIPLDELLKQRHARMDLPVKPLEPMTQSHKSEAVNTGPSGNQPLEKLEDVSRCDLKNLQSQGFSGINDWLVSQVRKYGYFQVMLRFEKSPLYKAYLEAGNTMLLKNSSEYNKLPKEIFEQIVDLIKNMQVSQTK
jgi:hypothetical protein